MKLSGDRSACLAVVFIVCVFLPVLSRASSSSGTLRSLLRKQNLKPMDPGPDFSDAKVKLGKKLFFDKLLSGNKDISCAGCHHPAQATSDGLALSIGTKADGTHFNRTLGEDRQFVPRNAQDIWNRGSPRWRTLFRDMRVRKVPNTDLLLTPAGFELPDEIENLQAAQAMIPVTSRDEMRGDRGDRTVNGDTNELALIPEGQFEEIWSTLWKRLRRNPEYRHLFRNAYPDSGVKDLSFTHAANAIAAYQIEAFTFLNSPWDRYLKGDDDALTPVQKKGAKLFYGKARCSQCHAGPLMTDQKAHNIAVPQLGPGKEPDEPYDLGFYRETGNPEDRFAFRTPPLRNVAVTGPWMHNGAYSTLRKAVEHHLAPEESLRGYSSDQLAFDLRAKRPFPLTADGLSLLPRSASGRMLMGTVRDSPEEINLILKTLDSRLKGGISLDNREIDQIMAFLQALTSPSVVPRSGKLPEPLTRTIPDTVPSGLPVLR